MVKYSIIIPTLRYNGDLIDSTTPTNATRLVMSIDSNPTLSNLFTIEIGGATYSFDRASFVAEVNRLQKQATSAGLP